MTEISATEIVHDADSRDHFTVLGLPRRLKVDHELLSKHYYTLSKLYHPDFHQAAAPAERAVSLRRSAAVNEAYKTLRDPILRGRWWLGFNGRKLGANPQVLPELAAMVFEVQECIEAFRERPEAMRKDELAARRNEVADERNRRLALLEDNFARWDNGPAMTDRERLLDELTTIIAELSYLTTLLRDIDRALENVGS